MEDEEILAAVKTQWEHWSEHVGIQNWTPLFRINADAHGAMGVDWMSGYKKVAFDIKPFAEDRAIEYSPEILSRNVLHECLHLAQYRVVEFGREEMGATVGKSLLWLVWEPAMEDANDTLTSIVFRMHAQTGCGR